MAIVPPAACVNESTYEFISARSAEMGDAGADEGSKMSDCDAPR